MIEVGCLYSMEPVLKHAAIVREHMKTMGHRLNGDCGPADQTSRQAIGYNAAANPNLNLNPLAYSYSNLTLSINPNTNPNPLLVWRSGLQSAFYHWLRWYGSILTDMAGLGLGLELELRLGLGTGFSIRVSRVSGVRVKARTKF